MIAPLCSKRNAHDCTKSPQKKRDAEGGKAEAAKTPAKRQKEKA